MKYRIRHCPNPTRWQERILAGVEATEDGCWNWRTPATDGYGSFFYMLDGVRRHTGTHRAAWLAFVGDIPDDLVIDHLCRNRACCNPWHLELVSSTVNARRGDFTRRTQRQSPDVLQCMIHGREDGLLTTHPAANPRHPRYDIWICRICARANHTAWRDRTGRTQFTRIPHRTLG